MSYLGWSADGIARARAAGGIELEKYRQPGFIARIGVRRASDGGYCQGFESSHDPGADEWPDDRATRPDLPARSA